MSEKIDDEIKKRIKIFKADISNPDISTERIVRKYITFGTPYIFKDNEDLYFNFKEEIAKYYNIRPSCINVAGSAKLGFSINPKKIWRPITPNSDIDVFVIDSHLFEEYWKKLLSFYNLDARNTLSEDEEKKFFTMRKYLFKGWLRLDLVIPSIPDIKDYLILQKQLYNKYDNRKVAIGFYKNEDFFENYHILNINNIRKKYEK